MTFGRHKIIDKCTIVFGELTAGQVHGGYTWPACGTVYYY